MPSVQKLMPRFLAAAMLAMLFSAGRAQAHFPWIAMADFTPAPGEAAHLTVGWGHGFPKGDTLAPGDLEEIVMLSADGARIAVTPASDTEFATAAGLADGTYLVAARRKSSFYTKTTEGGRRQSKRGLDNAVKCSWSTMAMKAVVAVGSGEGRADAVVGHPLEIIPLANPATLRVGDALPVRVLFNGTPYQGELAAVHSDSAEGKTVTTDATGRGSVPITAAGTWLLRARHEIPYEAPEECDVESYVATLTFTIR